MIICLFSFSNMVKPKPFSVWFNIVSCFCICFSHALDTIKPGEILYSNETFVSANGMFELGFFSFNGSENMYLGIWFKNDRNKKAVWVGNRENPLVDSSAHLKIRRDGNLLLTDRRAVQTVVNEGAVAKSNDTIAKILDSGNLILMEGDNTIWQSFDYPTDTFLPGMKLGLFNIGRDDLKIQFLVSWLSPSLPGIGSYFLGIDGDNLTRFNVWRGDQAFQKIGCWNGNKFRFFFQSLSNNHNISYISSKTETYITFDNKESNVVSWFVMAYDGVINEFRMQGREILVTNHSLCDDDLVRNASACLVMIPSMCEDGDKFSKIRGIIPNSMLVSRPAPMSLSDCEIRCRSNCSCVAYASFYDDGTGCELYYGSKNDLLNSIERGDRTFYVRGDASKSNDKKRRKVLLIVVPVVITLILIFLFCLWRKCGCLGINGIRGAIRDILPLLSSWLSTNSDANNANAIELGKRKCHELPLLSFSSILAATDNFSDANKLGEGGFGPVYKGNMQGQEIAVKRLSQNSEQGLVEFNNEVELISKLQHRNLVKLLGRCIQRGEKILIYEYMHNKSLDFFIFDQAKRPLLDWGKRRHIIEGIAQGLLYLHKYSRLRIIHRDLKSSNILLDDDMNPKISDFGMARICLEDENETITKRLAGTYGYMSPEYAIHGLFSTKSDVFSFGVILLEIVNGSKNATFYEPNCSLNLLGYAWDLWNAGKSVELMDPSMAENPCSIEGIMQCIQVGLLCVQESAEDRPTMSDVVLMLSSKGASLPAPKKPNLSTLLSVADNLASRHRIASQNLETMSLVLAR